MTDEFEDGNQNPILDAIEGAEEVPDPLDGLVEKSASDPGAAFTPDALERLAALKQENRAAFEALRARLKRAGCRVTALDEALAEESGDCRRGASQTAEREGPPPYETRSGGIFWIKETKDGPVSIPLTNFSAVIASDVERDDGVERNRYFEMQAELGGRQHKFDVPATEFSGMSWVSRELGPRRCSIPG